VASGLADAPIRVRGARTHNLKSIDVEIPSRSLTVITGPSGAGKSSLAFDTIYAEAQRRFVESLTTEARQVLDRLPRPDVDSIEGLSPAIALEQRPPGRSPRSTLGTATEIADHLRLLFARLGQPHCPICGEPVFAESPQRIVAQVLAFPDATKVTLLAPVARGHRGDLAPLFDRLRRDGFVRARVDSETIDLGEVEGRRFSSNAHDVDVVVDRIVVKNRDALRSRLSDSIELSLRVGDGRMRIARELPDGSTEVSWHSERFACEKDDFVFPPMEPRLFSFNAPQGACPVCQGIGRRRVPVESRLVPDETRTLREGALVAWGASGSVAYAVELARAVDSTGVDPDVKWSKLPAASRAAILRGGKIGKKKPYEGALAWIDQRLARDEDSPDDEGALDDAALDDLRDEVECEACKGARLRPEALAVKIARSSIAEIGAMPLPKAHDHLARYLANVEARVVPVAKPLVEPVLARIGFLVEIGLHYLDLDRTVATMSAGEVQRIRLATQLASGLKGILYVLDEPTIGLHAQDTERLIAALRRLQSMGNTIVVVEHDLSVIRAADEVLDIGPVAGRQGGHVVAHGTPDAIARDEKSVTGPWLTGRAELPRFPGKKRDEKRALRLRGASLHNLRNLDVEIPLGLLVAITGPSGSGKSSLVEGTLLPAVRDAIAARGRKIPARSHLKSIDGASLVDKIVAIDQSPLGRTPRSSAATYTGVMPKLREIFAALPEAKARGYRAGRFSTNVKGGRCETCRGEGLVRVGMAFLPDAWVVCGECEGARFDRETLSVRFKGKSIADVLAMSVDDAHALFEAIPQVREPLAAMRALGLGYLPLGQSATTLSGGEAQRVRLARELARRATGATLYVLDEPTTGLHAVDVALLLDALVALRDQGNTVVVVEHDLELVSRADWVIDLGPGGGTEGGEIVASGPPDSIRKGVTAKFLRATAK